jgi:hypothetical protein
MSNKSLAILGIVAAVTVILAMVVSGLSERPRTGATGPVYLIQGLDPAAIGKIVVKSDKDVVTLNRRGNIFAVADKSDYPADMEKINELIRNCADIKTTGSAQTGNPANHDDLGVTEDKGRSVVKFFTPDPNSKLITGVVVGKSLETGQGAYVRLLPKDSVYLATESLWIKSRPTDYIDQELLTVKREDINSVTVSPGGESYTLKAGESDAVSLENLPPGKKLKNTDARSVLTALTDLRFDDVARSIGGLAFNEQYVCRLNDRTVYTLSIAKKDDKTYVLCKADFDGRRPTEIKKDESPEELKKKEALLLAFDSAAVFSARHKSWIYEIPEWKAKNLTKKLSDLLEDVEKPNEPNEPAKPKPPAEPKVIQTPAPKPPEAEKPKPAIPQSVAPDGAKVEDPNATRH